MSFINIMHGSGLLSLAAVLAATTLPAAASAQDGGRGHRGGGHEARGSWNGGSGSHGGGRGAWRDNGGGQTSGSETRRGGGGGGQAWRQRSAPSAEQSAPQQSRRWASPQVSEGWANRAARTQRDSGEWQARRAEAARQWSQRQGGNAQGGSVELRNRSYSDQNRNRSYQADSWRNRAQQRDNDSWRDNRWRNDAARSEEWRRRNDGNWNRDNWRSERRSYGDSHRRWNHDWRRDNRYNWYSYRNHNRNHYRMGRYYAPYDGWSYRRFGIGFRLNSLFYSSRYWIDDPWSYRLPDAYGPYRWVRYYDDALLVDIYTGEVVDVMYDFFW